MLKDDCKKTLIDRKKIQIKKNVIHYNLRCKYCVQQS